MPRFYTKPPLPNSGSFELTLSTAHHAMRVLRLRKSDKVEIFDGIGNECRGEIVEVSGKRVVVGNISATDSNRESILQVVLAQAMPSSEKMDWVIQKATELGVAEIQPLDTDRSVAKLSAERIEKRLWHWQHVAISSCEQCGRNVLPKIHSPQDIMVWLQSMRSMDDTKLILLPEGVASLRDQAPPQGKIVLLVGAEGGFSAAERDVAQQCGFISIRMGTRVLRTETTGVVAIAAVQTLWGDFK